MVYLLLTSSISFADINSTLPNVPSFSFFYKEKNLQCKAEKIIKKRNHRDFIQYSCKSEDTSTVEEGTFFANEGRSESERLRTDIKNNGLRSMIYTVQLSSKDAHRPRILATTAYRQLEHKFDGELLDRLLPARFYISFRPQLANSGVESEMKYRNAGSRAGFYYYHLFNNEMELMTQYEAKIKNNDDKAFIDFSDLSNSNTRLGYVSLKYEDYSILYGKYWSAYYDVADFTDYFKAYGKQGTGAFNNGGDGSESGTGRVANMIQLHVKKESYTITAQYQFSHDASNNLDTNYQYSTGASFVYNGFENIQLGTAFSYAKFYEITPLLKGLGIEGHDQAYIIGMTYKKDKFVVNGIFSYTKNHMNDDQGIYFDSVGAEFYMHYDVSKNIRVAGGGNWLIAHDTDYAGNFSIKKGLLSFQYTFGKATFDDLIYLEVAFSHGNLANGDALKPTVAIGLRYLFDL